MEPEKQKNIKKLTKIQKRVAALLSENEQFRNYDLSLIFAYWELHDGIKIENPPKVATSPATIIRARQKLQELGFFPPTIQEIIDLRQRRRDEIRNWANRSDDK
jgi:hypothetical protein